MANLTSRACALEDQEVYPHNHLLPLGWKSDCTMASTTRIAAWLVTTRQHTNVVQALRAHKTSALERLASKP
eukprot:963403-Amphidinium_carterae.1